MKELKYDQREDNVVKKPATDEGGRKSDQVEGGNQNQRMKRDNGGVGLMVEETMGLQRL